MDFSLESFRSKYLNKINQIINFYYTPLYKNIPYSQKKKAVDYLYKMTEIKENEYLDLIAEVKLNILKNKSTPKKKMIDLINQVYIVNLKNCHDKFNRNAFIFSCFVNGLVFAIFSSKILFYRKNFIFLITTMPLCYNTNRNMYLKNFDNLYPLFLEQKDDYLKNFAHEEELLKNTGFKN